MMDRSNGALAIHMAERSHAHGHVVMKYSHARVHTKEGTVGNHRTRCGPSVRPVEADGAGQPSGSFSAGAWKGDHCAYIADCTLVWNPRKLYRALGKGAYLVAAGRRSYPYFVSR